MTRHISLRMSARARAAGRKPRAQRVLRAIGADPAFVESVLGDLAEEHALRVACDGYVAALGWYVREALRSAPHLIASWFRYARRHERARFMACISGLAVTSLVALIVLLTRNGPPVSLAAGTADVVVINNELPVHLPIQVLDARGHLLDAGRVRYRWMSGAPVALSATGEVTCREASDAYIHVSLGALSRNVLLRCRPIRDFWLNTGGELVAGDSAVPMWFSADGPDGRPVELIAGSVTVRDSDIASLHDMRLRPKLPGTTVLTVVAGDHSHTIPIRVLSAAHNPGALGPYDAFIVPSLRVAAGETRRWPIAPGLYAISLRPDTAGIVADDERTQRATLVLAISNANCIANGPGQRYLCAALKGAEVIVYGPRGSTQRETFTGRLLVRRHGL